MEPRKRLTLPDNFPHMIADPSVFDCFEFAFGNPRSVSYRPTIYNLVNRGSLKEDFLALIR